MICGEAPGWWWANLPELRRRSRRKSLPSYCVRCLAIVNYHDFGTRSRRTRTKPSFIRRCFKKMQNDDNRLSPAIISFRYSFVFRVLFVVVFKKNECGRYWKDSESDRQVVCQTRFSLLVSSSWRRSMFKFSYWLCSVRIIYRVSTQLQFVIYNFLRLYQNRQHQNW